MLEEVRDAYVAFYGGDFDDEDETTADERDMIRRATEALAPFVDPHRALLLAGDHRDGRASDGVRFCAHPDCVLERRDYDRRSAEAMASFAADQHLEAAYEDAQNGGGEL